MIAETITLTRDGISATVKVGDVVRLVDGREATIRRLDHAAPFTVLGDVDGNTYSWKPDGSYCDHAHHSPLDIDLAALAHRAPARDAGVWALVERWRKEAKFARDNAGDIDCGFTANELRMQAAGIDKCAADLEAALSPARSADGTEGR